MGDKDSWIIQWRPVTWKEGLEQDTGGPWWERVIGCSCGTHLTLVIVDRDLLAKCEYEREQGKWGSHKREVRNIRDSSFF